MFRTNDHTLTERVGSSLTLAGIALIMFFTAPTGGDFSWSDAPRHALNGAFYLDLLRSLPLADPQAYAFDYYARYPALTILFYPPFLHLAEAMAYAAFGVSHAAAQATVVFFYFLAGIAAFAIARRYLPAVQALAVAVIFMCLPEMAFWGRQVMLDVPVIALLLWSVHAFLQYLDAGKFRWLYGAVILFAVALYTKQTVVFMVPVFLWALWSARGRSLFSSGHFWSATLLLLLLLIPLLAIQLKFGGYNTVSVVQGDGQQRWQPGALLFYIMAIPGQMGWPVAVLGSLGVVGLLIKPVFNNISVSRGFWLGWLLLGYGFFSLIALKSSRFTLPILFPLALLAVMFLGRVLAPRMADAAAVFLGVITLGITLAYRPVPYVEGYKQAADYLAMHVEPDSRILFSGYRDGSFIFNVRANTSRQDISVARADKLFYKVAVHRDHGIETTLSGETQDIPGLLDDNNIRWAVVEPLFWSDLPQMQRLVKVLRSDMFEEVKRIPVVFHNRKANEKELIIYRRRGSVESPGGSGASIFLPIIGREIRTGQ